LEIEFQNKPKRRYRLRWSEFAWVQPMNSSDPANSQWVEVPSVTTVLELVKDAGPLIWWGQRVGIEGMLDLIARELLPADASPDDVIDLFKQHKLTVNHVRDLAGDRGTNVHTVLENWVEQDKRLPDPAFYPERERGHITGLAAFLNDITPFADQILSEFMVASMRHRYAGRPDLRVVLPGPVTLSSRCYPKRGAVYATFPAGTYLFDLKTSKRVYRNQLIQLKAYEEAARESGYGPSDHQAVVRCSPEGEYEIVLSDQSFEDFLAVRRLFTQFTGL